MYISFLIYICLLRHSLVNSYVSDFELTKMVYDERGGFVYIGGVNHIIQFNAKDFTKVNTVVTGPVLDAPDYLPGLSDYDKRKLKPKDNRNNVLLIDNVNRVLLNCGTVLQGICSVHDLQNITKMTNLSQTYEYWVSSTDIRENVIAFIGPGSRKYDRLFYYFIPFNEEVSEDMFYLGGIRTLESSNNFKTYLKLEEEHASKIEVSPNIAKNFRAVNGFTHEGFAYFQYFSKLKLSSGTLGPASRIGRMCASTYGFDGWVDMPLSCKSGKTTYNEIQASTLVNGVLYNVYSSVQNGKPTFSLCSFKLEDVNKQLIRNLEDCIYGKSGRFGTPPNQFPCVQFYTQEEKPLVHECPASNIAEKVDDLRFNHLFGNSTSGLVMNATFVDNENITSIVGDYISDDCIFIALGTATGKIKKLCVNNKNEASVYEEVQIFGDTNPTIHSDMIIMNSSKLLVMDKISFKSVPLYDCSNFTNCDSCLSSAGPYCGWCIVTRECKPSRECSMLADSENQWLPFNTSCISILDVNPRLLTRNNPERKIKFTFNILPKPKNPLFGCFFDGQHAQADIDYSSSIITCEIKSEILNLRKDNYFKDIPVDISGWFTKNGAPVQIASTNVSVYDCTLFTSCSMCTSSRFNCDWCVSSSQCLYVDNPNNVICKNRVAGLKSTTSINQKGSGFCPAIRYENSNDIGFYSVGIDHRLKIKVSNLPVNINEKVKCIFIIEGKEMVIDGIVRNDDTVQCYKVKFALSGSVGEVRTPVFVKWGSSSEHITDNVNNVSITIYNCSMLANNCGDCIFDYNIKYHCVWCNSSESCSYNHSTTCDSPLPANTLCTRPIIQNFSPSKGPVQGGTRTKISGINFAQSPSAIESIHIDADKENVPCLLDSSSYVRGKRKQSSRFECVVNSTSRDASGFIIVTFVLRNQRTTATSLRKFHFVRPIIYDFKPKMGPVGGGTLITIKGSDLDAGTSCEVWFSSIPCNMDGQRRSFDTLHCRIIVKTPTTPKKHSLKLIIDNMNLRKPYPLFSFMANPIVREIHQEVSFIQGGQLVNVTGEGFSSIQTALMTVKAKDREFRAKCSIFSDTEMACYTPSIDKINVTIYYMNRLNVEVGFIMDAVNMASWSTTQKDFTFYYMKNPEIYPMSGVIKYTSNSQIIVLTIINIPPFVSSKHSYVSIKIGPYNCKIVSVTKQNISCLPPALKERGKTFQITVRIGNSFREIGSIEYPRMPTTSLPVHTLIGIMVIFLLSFICCTGVVWRCIQKRTKERDQMKQKLKMLQEVENKIYKECQESFAELHLTPINIITDSSQLPYNDYKTYCAKILFPLYGSSHRVFTGQLGVNTESEQFQTGMKLFHDYLLMDPYFLLLFIRTVEAELDFQTSQKSELAALLMVAFQEKLDYITEILFILLTELFGDAFDGREKPKALLKKTESVLENLLRNWLAFLLYDHATKSVGPHLFNLYKAIKQLSERGPVDEITGDAKFSLTQENILADYVEHGFLDLNIILQEDWNLDRTSIATEMEGLLSGREYVVTVLTCDSINQVKDKILDVIYGNFPYSKRKNRDCTELVYTTHTEQIVLREEKIEGFQNDSPVKMQKIGDYNLPPGAKLTIQERRRNLPINSATMTPLTKAKNRMSIALTLSRGSINSYQTLNENKGRYDHLLGFDNRSESRYHLCKGALSASATPSKEVFNVRLIQMKKWTEEHIKYLFESILQCQYRDTSLPPCIQFLFDFLDSEAIRYKITDKSVLHIWKNNSLLMRFWSFIIRNPNRVFDINQTKTEEASLRAVEQLFADAASAFEGRNSHLVELSANRMLFAQLVPFYHKWVLSFYSDVQKSDKIANEDMKDFLKDESMKRQGVFNNSYATYLLFQIFKRYQEQVLVAIRRQFNNEKTHQFYVQISKVNSCLGLEEPGYGIYGAYTSSQV